MQRDYNSKNKKGSVLVGGSFRGRMRKKETAEGILPDDFEFQQWESKACSESETTFSDESETSSCDEEDNQFFTYNHAKNFDQKFRTDSDCRKYFATFSTLTLLNVRLYLLQTNASNTLKYLECYLKESKMPVGKWYAIKKATEIEIIVQKQDVKGLIIILDILKNTDKNGELAVTKKWLALIQDQLVLRFDVITLKKMRDVREDYAEILTNAILAKMYGSTVSYLKIKSKEVDYYPGIEKKSTRLFAMQALNTGRRWQFLSSVTRVAPVTDAKPSENSKPSEDGCSSPRAKNIMNLISKTTTIPTKKRDNSGISAHINYFEKEASKLSPRDRIFGDSKSHSDNEEDRSPRKDQLSSRRGPTS